MIWICQIILLVKMTLSEIVEIVRIIVGVVYNLENVIDCKDM